MIRKLVTILGTLGILAFGVGIVALMSAMTPEPERQEAAQRLPVVFVDEAEYAPVQLEVSAQGEVRPRREIALTTQVGGRIIEVADEFVNGGVIDRGQLLVQLESADYESTLTRARARVATAQQALELEEAEAALAERDFRELTGGEGDPSALTLRQPQLARAKAEYEAALADLADAELAVERTRIRAPFDGRVRQTSADTGQFVGPGTELARLFSTDVAEIRLPLTDEDLARLNLPFAFEAPVGEGPTVQLSARVAGRERQWTGHVVRTDAAIDPTTRQIAAIVRVNDPYGAGAYDSAAVEGGGGFPLAIGLFVDAVIEGPTLDSAIVLPRQALAAGDVVFTVDEEDRVVENEVAVAAITPAGVVVTDGIEPGARVVISRLPTGAGGKVRPLSQDGGAAAPRPDAASPEAGAAGRAGAGSTGAGR